MTRITGKTNARPNERDRDWSDLGRKILDVARMATAVHLVGVTGRMGVGDEAEESPSVLRGG
jgi:hypothetical protein